MPATGPHTFTDEDGEHWEIVGPYEHAPTYVRIQSLDNPGKTSLRPAGVLGPAGLSVPTLPPVSEELDNGDDMCYRCGHPRSDDHADGCPHEPPEDGVTMTVTIIDTGEPPAPPLYPALAEIEASLQGRDGLGRTAQFVRI